MPNLTPAKKPVEQDEDFRQELLAQALWAGFFGFPLIAEQWVEFRDDNKNKDEVAALRDQAAQMLGLHDGTMQTKNNVHSSLGWLDNLVTIPVPSHLPASEGAP